MEPAPPTQEPLPSARSFGATPRWLVILFACLLFLSCLLVAPYFIKPHHPGCDLMEAANNIRVVGILLFSFEEEFGAFPSPATARALARKQNLEPLSTTTSNDLLSQLILGGFTNNEEVFHARHPDLPRNKPDNIVSPPDHLLEPGECGFSYVTGLSTASPGACPLLLWPMIPGTTTFDRKAGAGSAAVLLNDQSVKNYPIDNSGHVILPNGLDLFDPAQPFWNGKSPDLRHPAQ